MSIPAEVGLWKKKWDSSEEIKPYNLQETVSETSSSMLSNLVSSFHLQKSVTCAAVDRANSVLNPKTGETSNVEHRAPGTPRCAGATSCSQVTWCTRNASMCWCYFVFTSNVEHQERLDMLVLLRVHK